MKQELTNSGLEAVEHLTGQVLRYEPVGPVEAREERLGIVHRVHRLGGQRQPHCPSAGPSGQELDFVALRFGSRDRRDQPGGFVAGEGQVGLAQLHEPPRGTQSVQAHIGLPARCDHQAQVLAHVPQRFGGLAREARVGTEGVCVVEHDVERPVEPAQPPRQLGQERRTEPPGAGSHQLANVRVEVRHRLADRPAELPCEDDRVGAARSESHERHRRTRGAGVGPLGEPLLEEHRLAPPGRRYDEADTARWNRVQHIHQPGSLDALGSARGPGRVHLKSLLCPGRSVDPAPVQGRRGEPSCMLEGRSCAADPLRMSRAAKPSAAAVFTRRG